MIEDGIMEKLHTVDDHRQGSFLTKQIVLADQNGSIRVTRQLLDEFSIIHPHATQKYKQRTSTLPVPYTNNRRAR